MRNHLRKRNHTKRCYVCKELGHLAWNYMNKGKVEDANKSKASKIKTQMKQKWVKKSTKNLSQISQVIDTQKNEFDDSFIYA